MSQMQFSQPTCKYCNKQVDWNKKRREQLGWNGPLNLDGTPHDCRNQQAAAQQQQAQQAQKTYYSSPNPSGYTGNSQDYVNNQPPPPQQPQQQLQPQHQDNTMAMLKEIQGLRHDIDQVIMVIQQMNAQVNEFIKDNPIYRAQLQFQAEMFPILNNQQNKVGFKTADQVKDEDIGMRLHHPNNLNTIENSKSINEEDIDDFDKTDEKLRSQLET